MIEETIPHDFDTHLNSIFSEILPENENDIECNPHGLI